MKGATYASTGDWNLLSPQNRYRTGSRSAGLPSAALPHQPPAARPGDSIARDSQSLPLHSWASLLTLSTEGSVVVVIFMLWLFVSSVLRSQHCSTTDHYSCLIIWGHYQLTCFVEMRGCVACYHFLSYLDPNLLAQPTTHVQTNAFLSYLGHMHVHNFYS